jgi:energy-coupling factor transporter transmembrane protein EcfT
VLLGGAVAAVGSGPPLYARSLLLTALFIALSLLTVWTTRVEELPVAFVRIVRPLRRLGAPVDEWAHTLTLTVRTLPLLREEFRVLLAARRLRPSPPATGRVAQMRDHCREVLDLTVAVIASAGRRASDLGRAATLRGGMHTIDR